MRAGKWIGAAALAAALVLAGCATPKNMAFHKDTTRYTEKSKPIFLMTATLRNVYKPTFQPRLLVVHVEKPDAKEVADRLNFKMDDKGTIDESDSEIAGNSYLIRLWLDPGTYQIEGMTGLGRFFPVQGFYFVPLHSTLEVKEKGVYYLGHVSATVRERRGNEFRAGAPMPVLDQALVGASDGTFDINITDQFATDEALFRARFPQLAGVTIQKAILPQFDRAKAQAWWEAH